MLAPQAESAFHRDVKALIAKMYDAIDARNVDRDALRDATYSIETLTMAVLTPQAAIAKWGPLGTTVQERRLAEIIFARPGHIYTKDALRDALYFNRIDDAPEVKIIDVFVCKLRRALERSRYGIETVWGVGYKGVIAPEGEVYTPPARSRPLQGAYQKMSVFDGELYGNKTAAWLAQLHSKLGQWVSVKDLGAATSNLYACLRVVNARSKNYRFEHGGGFVRLIKCSPT